MQQLEPFSPFEDKFPERIARALSAAHEIDAGMLDGSTPDLLIDAIVNDFAAQEIVPLYDEFRIDTRDEPRNSNDPLPTGALPLNLIFTLPCRGAATLLLSTEPRVVHSSMGVSGPNGLFEVMHTRRLSVDSQTDGSDFTENIAKFRSAWLEKIGEATTNANLRIAEHREAVRAAITPIVMQRHLQRRLVSQATSTLNIPLDRAHTDAVPLPLAPRTLNLAAVESAVSAGGNEQGLAVDIANALVDLIASFSVALERMPVTANKLAGENEESIRDVLLFLLNANWKGTATGETFLGEGKTDILLRWRNRDAFIGECKFWKGKKHFSEGLEQLLGRYTVWRATRVAVILFIRDVENVTSTIDKALETIRAHERFIGPSGSGNAEHKSFLMRAQSDHRQVITLTLIPVVIPDKPRT